MKKLILQPNEQPPAEGADLLPGTAMAGDRVAYRDAQMMLDGFVIAQVQDMSLVAVLNVTSMVPLQTAQLVVLERSALVRSVRLQ